MYVYKSFGASQMINTDSTKTTNQPRTSALILEI